MRTWIPHVVAALAMIAAAILLVVAVIFAWHIASALFLSIGALVDAAIDTLKPLLRFAVAVATGLVFVGAPLLIALAVAVLVLCLFEAIEKIAASVQQFSDEAKAAAADASSLAVLAGMIGILAYLTTGEILGTSGLGFPHVIAVSTMFQILLKMALYVDSKFIRRAVWPLLLITYIVPFGLGYYLLFGGGCESDGTARALAECLLKPPEGKSTVERAQLLGLALIILLAGTAMIFPLNINTWKRFLGRKQL